MFPILIILGGIVTNFSDKRIPEKNSIMPQKVKWTNIWLFVLLFLIVGIFSETARKHQWEIGGHLTLLKTYTDLEALFLVGEMYLCP